MWWLSPSLRQQSPSAEWTLWLTWSICLCVAEEGEAAGEECNPLSHLEKGKEHAEYHKGASAKRNVYMMSNDSPKIGHPS